MKTLNSFEKDVPLCASCHKLTFSAPFRWLKKGWQDYRHAPWHSLIYGVIFASVAWVLIYFSSFYESYLLGGILFSFLLVGPMLAFGLYDISQQLEQKRTPTFSHERNKAFHEMGHELMLALLLGVVFLIMLLVASIVTNNEAWSLEPTVLAVIPITDEVSLITAAIFAGLLFCAGTFALPMILDRDADAMTAIITSLHAVWRNKSVLALWILLILALVAVGFATALAGFVLIVPALGYASWHAYRETII